MERIENREGNYVGMMKEAKRYVFSFDEGDENPKRYSAFEPLQQLSELVIGERYAYEVEHVPTKEEGKFYHNLTRTARNEAFKIHSIGPAPKQATMAPGQSGPRKATQTEIKDAREEMYRNKDIREAEKDRQYRLSLPYINAVALAPGVLNLIANLSLNPKFKENLDREGFDTIFDTMLRQVESVVEKRLPAEVAYNRKPEQKKDEPIEAEV